MQLHVPRDILHVIMANRALVRRSHKRRIVHPHVLAQIEFVGERFLARGARETYAAMHLVVVSIEHCLVAVARAALIALELVVLGVDKHVRIEAWFRTKCARAHVAPVRLHALMKHLYVIGQLEYVAVDARTQVTFVGAFLVRAIMA